MVFSAPLFLFLFLPVTFLLVYISGKQYRNGILLLSSLFFYAWGETFFVFVMIGSILTNFIFGKWIEHSGKGLVSKIALSLCIVFNLGLIVYFKYSEFLIDALNSFLGQFHLATLVSNPIALPIGISFFTFQNISYAVDVYRREIESEKNPVNYALYISFFPHLIAGPIVRYVDIAADIRSRTMEYSWMASGIRRFIIGLSKKVLIANTLAWVADELFKLPSAQLNTPLAWLAILAYSFQIFFDFSGYSDMAIGLSRVFGFNFLENFNFPYIARSVTEFWRRWHMSLSNWFRDYVYIPLGGNRKGKFRLYFNLLLVFFLTGLWHGASWNYIVWGMIHGFFITMERIGGNKLLEKLWRPLSHVYLLLIVVISWTFFRLENFPEALRFVGILFGGGTQSTLYSLDYYFSAEILFVFTAAIFFSMPFPKALANSISVNSYVHNGLYILLLLLSLMGLAAGTYNPFIYFRF